MIINLYVENYVIIERVSLDLSAGFSCFTGETGAGKSLIVDALSVLLGNRLSVDLIRKDCDICRIEATVAINDPEITKELQENGFSSEDNYVFSREINRDNRTFSRINGRTCTLTLMKNILSKIIDIHSQHDNQYLLNKKYHLRLLDNYIHDPLFVQVQENFRTYSALLNKYTDLIDKRYSPSELEFLQFQVKEIDDLALKDGEIEDLEQRYKLIAGFEKSAQKLEEAIGIIANNNLKENLWQAIKELETFSTEEINEITKKLRDSYYSLEEGSSQLNAFRRKIDFSEDEVNAIQNRLFEIKKVQRKFGSTFTEIMAKKEEMLLNIDEINNSEEYLLTLKAEVESALYEYLLLAQSYRDLRKEKAQELVGAIKKNLDDLDLPNSRFEVQFLEKEPALDGIDDVEFLLSTNKNVDMRPLAKVASGGELSRIMLGLKIIFTALQGISTIVFDEIDTGVSGTTAFSVGMKMQELSQQIQVLSVSHLAQVAACSWHHYYVNKLLVNEQTTTVVSTLSAAERIQQLAVLGFGMINDDSLAAAKLLFEHGQSSLQT